MIGDQQNSGKCNPEDIIRALYRLSNVVSCAPTENDLYPHIQEAISPVVDTTNFFIGLYEESADRLTFPYFVDEKDRAYSVVEQVSITDTNSAEVIRTGKAVLLSRQQTASLRAASARDHHNSSIAEIWLGVPLKARGRVIGVMVVQSYSDPGLYDQNDLSFLVAVAGIVGPALDFQRTDRIRQENELRYRRLSENTTDAIFVTDMAGRITDVNRAACDTLGYSREEMLKMTVADIDCGVSNEEFRVFHGNSPEGTSRSFEAVHQRRDGTTFPVEISSLKYRENNRDYIVGIARDITERKKSEEELRIFAERMQVYFSSANDAILVHPLQEEGVARFVEVNDVACIRYGYTHDEFLQLTADDITNHGDTDLHTLRAYRRELLEKGVSFLKLFM